MLGMTKQVSLLSLAEGKLEGKTELGYQLVAHELVLTMGGEALTFHPPREITDLQETS